MRSRCVILERWVEGAVHRSPRDAVLWGKGSKVWVSSLSCWDDDLLTLGCAKMGKVGHAFWEIVKQESIGKSQVLLDQKLLL